MKKRMTHGLLALVCFAATMALSSCTKEVEKKKVLRHVVTFEFKDEVSAARREQAIQDFLDLKDKIPQIKKFEGGEDISTEGLTRGFTHCFILTFDDEKARDIYIPHPAHLELANKNKPLMKNLIVIDFWGEE